MAEGKRQEQDRPVYASSPITDAREAYRAGQVLALLMADVRGDVEPVFTFDGEVSSLIRVRVEGLDFTLQVLPPRPERRQPPPSPAARLEVPARPEPATVGPRWVDTGVVECSCTVHKSRHMYCTSACATLSKASACNGFRPAD